MATVNKVHYGLYEDNEFILRHCTAGSVSISQLILFLFDCVYCWHSSSMVAPGNNDTQDWLTGSISMSVQKLQPQCRYLVNNPFYFRIYLIEPSTSNNNHHQVNYKCPVLNKLPTSPPQKRIDLTSNEIKID